MALTPIQEQIVKMQALAVDLVKRTVTLATADAKAVAEINGDGLTTETYDEVKAAVDACHIVALQHYGLGIIAHTKMGEIAPEPPGEPLPLGGGGGKVEPPYPPGP